MFTARRGGVAPGGDEKAGFMFGGEQQDHGLAIHGGDHAVTGSRGQGLEQLEGAPEALMVSGTMADQEANGITQFLVGFGSGDQ
jgi:hypothetical protein